MSSESKNNDKKKKVVCENCDKSTQQKELPAESSSSKGMPCSKAYEAVSKCMDVNKGQVSACSKEWSIFRDCHDENR